MKVLIACEESQEVCKAFRAKGHEAYSADIQEPSGGHPEWHILGDVLPIINGDCKFTTMDGAEHEVVGEWDLLIAHPPCTYLTVTGGLTKKGMEKKPQRESDCEKKPRNFLCNLQMQIALELLLKTLLGI